LPMQGASSFIDKPSYRDFRITSFRVL